jgi:tetratricopeptide (TPR) repeat protein
VQYFGSKHHEHARRFDLLAPLLEITATLDPQLLVVYEFGANFLTGKPPHGAGEPERAVQLVQFGIRHNPDQWRLYYNLGFIYYLDLKDYASAADAFERGSRTPNAHPWLKILAAQMAQHAGEIATARMIWNATYETTKDPGIQANAIAHLRALQVDEDVPRLEQLVAKYRETTGRLPSSFKELIAAGMLKSVPLDPLGYPYELTTDGHVLVLAPNDLPFIQKGLPPGYVAPTRMKPPSGH